jgi:periplasmic copper chaperone A
MGNRAIPVLIAVVVALVLAPVAAAHVTLNPREWEAGGFAKFDVRVPNERDNADTTRVTVQFPEGVISASFEDVPGWRRTVKMAQLDEPIEEEGEPPITERIDTVTWTGGRVEPGEFQEFPVSFQVPEEDPGTVLSFPSIQRYSNGETVRWIGPEDAESPAPTVTVLEAPPEEGAAAEPAATETAAPAEPASAASEDEGGSDTLSIIALIVGIAGLAAGLGALLMARGRRKVTA